MDILSQVVDSSFKYILLGFNLLTLIFVYFHKKRIKVIKQHHILFVFAHPDDEAMFFGPTITGLSAQYYIHFLCLSHGNSIRASQLEKSAKYFEVYKHQCIHDENMIDGMKSTWDQETIRSTVKKYVEENNIKAIFTFDQSGISGHLNHRTIYQALSELEVSDSELTEGQSKSAQELKNQQSTQQSQQKPLIPQKQKSSENEQEKKEETQNQGKKLSQEKKAIKIYYLQTTNIIRKYLGLLEIFLVPFKTFSWVRFNYFHGYNSMALHQSQFVWYRKLFVFFSRYTYINTFRMKKIKFK